MPLSELNKMSAVRSRGAIAASQGVAGGGRRGGADSGSRRRSRSSTPSFRSTPRARWRPRGVPKEEIASGKPLGPLHGVPVSVKDLIDVHGLKATYGSLTLKDAIAAADAPSVERLRAAGAIIIGKTTTSEFGYRGYTRASCTATRETPGTWGARPADRAAGPSPRWRPA